MLSIQIDKLGKKFNREWIFRSLSYTIPAGHKLAILGANGSGKSTFLQIVSGFVMPNEGQLHYYSAAAGPQTALVQEKVKDQVALAAPYLQLIEELTLQELVAHVSLYKPFVASLTTAQVIDRMELSHARHKLLKQFSSGMRQRVRLGLALLSHTPLLLLDEPVSNLDRASIAWYQGLMQEQAVERTVIVCSNAVEEEYAFFCKSQLTITDFKPGVPKK